MSETKGGRKRVVSGKHPQALGAQGQQTCLLHVLKQGGILQIRRADDKALLPPAAENGRILQVTPQGFVGHGHMVSSLFLWG